MKELKDYTDLELAELVSQTNQQLMIVQQNLLAVNREIEERKSKIKLTTKK